MHAQLDRYHILLRQWHVFTILFRFLSCDSKYNVKYTILHTIYQRCVKHFDKIETNVCWHVSPFYPGHNMLHLMLSHTILICYLLKIKRAKHILCNIHYQPVGYKQNGIYPSEWPDLMRNKNSFIIKIHTKQYIYVMCFNYLFGPNV